MNTPSQKTPRTRRPVLRGLTTAALLAAVAVPAVPRTFAEDAPAKKAATDAPSQLTGKEITPEQKAAVDKGLEWLAKSIRDKGSLSSGMGGYSNNAGITALAGLALMQAGNLPGRGKYGKEVQTCLDFVLASCRRDGLIASDASQGPMYGHGFATLFLGEVYGMTGNEEVKEKLQKAVTLIQKTQNSEGGWRYQPAPYDADISVTICEVMALRAARDAGIKVEKDVIDKAVAYVRRCQNPDGGFNYMAGQGAGGSGFPRSAAGVASLYYAGINRGRQRRARAEVPQAVHPRQGRRRPWRGALLLRPLLRRPGQLPRRRRVLGQLVPGHPRRAGQAATEQRRTGTATSARTTPPRWPSSSSRCPTATSPSTPARGRVRKAGRAVRPGFPDVL